MKVTIIGGGAAGFFAAISCKIAHPKSDVCIFEKTNKLLSKVKVSGGGRCNVTHACFSNTQLVKFYPRGEKKLKKPFEQFNTSDTVKWFEERGVALKTESDNRMFPVSNDSQTIVDCLLNEARKRGVEIRKKTAVTAVKIQDDNFELKVGDEVFKTDQLIVATGGSPKASGYDWLKTFGHTILSPVPSLFTFNMPDNSITELMGVSVKQAVVRIQGTKLKHEGPLLITHWGVSGPAVLKLSAWGARELHQLDYKFKIQVNWLGTTDEAVVREQLKASFSNLKKKKLGAKNPFDLPNRLWSFFLKELKIDEQTNWSEFDRKSQNRLLNMLLNNEFEVNGKTTFKEEFVTCGGVPLNEVNMDTMESKCCSGLYFTGEVLDIDGVTGGFNFQAAWTTAHIAGQLRSE